MEMSYWGNHTSLYTTLPRHSLLQLERAIRYQIRGEYSESLHSFALLDESISRLPVTLIERAILYDRMGLVQEQIRLLNAVEFHSLTKSQKPGTDEWDLLVQLRARADLYCNGKIEPAFSAACVIAAQLKRKEVCNFSDIEVHCALECWRVFGFCRMQSNFLDAIQENILNAFPKITTLRRSLQGQHQFHLAQSLMQHEDRLDNDKSRSLEAYESFLDAFSTHAQAYNKAEPTQYKLALTHIEYAEVLALASSEIESHHQLEVALRLLGKDDASFPSPVPDIPPTARLLMSKVETKFHATKTRQERKAVSLCCASEAEAFQDWPMYREHMKDALSQSWKAKEEYDSVAQVAEVKNYLRNLTKYIKFENENIRSGVYLAPAIWRFGIAARQEGGSRLEHFLDMVKEFEHKFPDFSVPGMLSVIASSAAEVARMLGDEATTQHFQLLKRKVRDKCPWMVKSAGQYVLRDDLPDKYSTRRWAQDPNDLKKDGIARIASRLILKWVCRELRENELSIIEAEKLLQWTSLRQALIKESYDLPQYVNPDVLPHHGPEKLCNILFNIQMPLEYEAWGSWFSSLKSWLQSDQLPTKLQRLHLLKEIQETRYTRLSYLIISSGSPASQRRQELSLLRIKEAKRSLILHQELRLSNPEAVDEFEVLACQSKYATDIRTLALSRGAKERGFLTDDLILEAITVYKALADNWATGDKATNLHRALSSMGTLMWTRWFRFRSVGVESCLPIFRQAEELYRRIRVQDAFRSSSRALMSTSRLARALDMPGIYEKARCAAVVAYQAYQDVLKTSDAPHDSTLEAHAFQLISWCQGSKAQALADILGLEAKVPESVMASIRESEGAIRSLAREKAIFMEMSNASFSRKVQLREEWQDLQADILQEEPSLRPILDMRSGNVISHSSFLELAEVMGKDVAIVDWMVAYGSPAPTWMLLYRDGRLCNLIPLYHAPKKTSIPREVRMGELDTWVNDYLINPVPLSRDYEDDPDPSQDLNCRLLLGLVSPLQDLTKAGEKLIFCPTQSLHRIPLHALRLAGTPIIERNPIIYVQNTTLLRFTMQHSEQGGIESDKILRVIVFNTLGDSREVAQSLARLSNILRESDITTTHCTKENFAELGVEADIIHAHGHISFDPNDLHPLKHHLILGYPANDPKNQLTADEICNLKFRRGALIMAMGCDSGRAQQSDCDDLLGLTAAFHCAGAGTVVSTLWMIDADDCMQFSSAFYAYVVAQLRTSGDGSRMVDLAVAMQKGITAVRYDGEGNERDPYHWAGFVLHGSWMFPRRKLLASQSESFPSNSSISGF